MYNDTLTPFGIIDIDKYKAIIDIRTGYINGTKLVANFLTRKNTPKRFDNWKAQNKEKINLILREVRDKRSCELLSGNIMYQLNGSLDAKLPHAITIALNIKFTSAILTLDEINKQGYFTTSPIGIANFIKGTYIHMSLCTKLIEWIDPCKEDMLCVRILNYFKKRHMVEAILSNDSLCNKAITQNIHASPKHNIVPGHIPISYKHTTLHVIVLDEVMYVNFTDIHLLIDSAKILPSHISTFKCLYNKVYYEYRHPLGGQIYKARYVCLPKIYNILPDEPHAYFTSILTYIKDNSNMLCSKVPMLYIEHDTSITPYLGMYVIYLGIYDNMHLFKYGTTNSIVDTMYYYSERHGDVKLVKYIRAYRPDVCVFDLNMILGSIGLLVSRYSNVFTITDRFNYQYIISLLNRIKRAYTTPISQLNTMDDLRRRIKMKRSIFGITSN